jgi:cytochrome oxidase assembly protein ShyY1
VYRFLATARWLGFAALAVSLAATMVGLGLWQLDRYHQRSSVNARIDAATRAAAVPVAAVLTAGEDPPPGAAWTRVTGTGRYDPAHEIVVRERTVDSRVGFEILDPLRLPDGSAVLVDRGWLPADATGGALALPAVPPAPAGEVTVTGLVHLPESRASAATRTAGVLTVRRIAPSRLASSMPYPVLGGYVVIEQPEPGFTVLPVDHQNSGMNAGYVVQWWAFALLTLLGFAWAAYRQAHPQPTGDRDLAAVA